MLLVRVACGKVFERPPLHHSPEYQSLVHLLASQQLAPGHLKEPKQDKTRELLRMPTNRSCPDGYHSQLGVDISGNRKSKSQVVVNKNFQVLRAYLPAYRVTRVSRHLPPWGGLTNRIRSARVNMPSRPLTSTRPLTLTARHRMCFCSSRGVRHVKAA
jgi:hypothetical protein